MTLGRRWTTFVLLGFIAFVVNFPLAHSRYLDWQLEKRGVEVVAEVTDTRAVADGFLVQFTIPADGRRAEFVGAVVEVDELTYDNAVETDEISVRVLPDNGGVFEAEGQKKTSIGLVITLLADLFLLAVVVLAWRFRVAMRVELVLRATEDLERCPPGPRLDRLDGLRYLVAGDVAEIGDDEVVLDLGDRRVRVLLDGHDNPAGYQQSVSVVGHMVA